MKNENLTNYITPIVEVVNIETEQCILNSSNQTENVGTRHDDMDW